MSVSACVYNHHVWLRTRKPYKPDANLKSEPDLNQMMVNAPLLLLRDLRMEKPMKSRFSVEKCLKLVLQMNAHLDIDQMKKIFIYFLSARVVKNMFF